jgi:pimeloyl-ACP methyl ester carboxylesterase
VVAPTLFVHGGRDRIVPCSHSQRLAQRCPEAELRLSSDDGHLSILRLAAQALASLRQHSPSG